ncbi:MAG: hypothetical protein H7232_17735 [Aeromicrobium sp.]|nr:hypothetical protein [Burkholderiales bacterium]
MFEFFKKKPVTALDSMSNAVYGNAPPKKRADLGHATNLASELLMHIVDVREISEHAIALDSGPIPSSTHELALMIALDFFAKPTLVSNVFDALLIARMPAVEWYRQNLVAPMLVETFETILYELYKPGRRAA